jgi:hypothetical protein
LIPNQPHSLIADDRLEDRKQHNNSQVVKEWQSGIKLRPDIHWIEHLEPIISLKR